MRCAKDGNIPGAALNLGAGRSVSRITLVLARRGGKSLPPLRWPANDLSILRRRGLGGSIPKAASRLFAPVMNPAPRATTTTPMKELSCASSSTTVLPPRRPSASKLSSSVSSNSSVAVPVRNDSGPRWLQLIRTPVRAAHADRRRDIHRRAGFLAKPQGPAATSAAGILPLSVRRQGAGPRFKDTLCFSENQQECWDRYAVPALWQAEACEGVADAERLQESTSKADRNKVPSR